MAAPSVVTGTVQAKLFMNTGTSTYTTPDDHADATSAAHFDTTKTDHLVKNCTSFGPVTKSGNPVEYTPYGDGETSSVAGAASLGELSFTITAIESDTVHGQLLTADVGAFIEVGLLKSTGSSGSTKEVIYYARGTVSGSEQTFDTPNELTLTIALAEAPSRFVKA